MAKGKGRKHRDFWGVVDHSMQAMEDYSNELIQFRQAQDLIMSVYPNPEAKTVGDLFKDFPNAKG